MATEGTDPSTDLPQAEFLRRRLRSELGKERHEAGFTQKVMAEQLSWSISKVVRIEQGTVSVAPSDVRAMLSLFGAEDDRINELVSLAREEREAKDWSEYDDILSPSYKELIGQEPSADTILKYEPGVVPGLFQISEYSSALFSDWGMPLDEADRFTEVRARRQGVLELEDGPELITIIGEIALVRPIGSEALMRSQIEHLIELSKRPNIAIFLMPFSAGGHIKMGSPFTILRFREQRIDDCLYLEDAFHRTTANEEPELVESYLKMFDQIEEKAEHTGPFEKHAARIIETYYS